MADKPQLKHYLVNWDNLYIGSVKAPNPTAVAKAIELKLCRKQKCKEHLRNFPHMHVPISRFGRARKSRRYGDGMFRRAVFLPWLGKLVWEPCRRSDREPPIIYLWRGKDLGEGGATPIFQRT